MLKSELRGVRALWQQVSGSVKLRRLRYVLGLALLGVLVLAVVESKTYYGRDALMEAVYGSKPHRVPCDQWPTSNEVQEVIDHHQEVVRQIESINPGFTVLRINTLSCQGRADIQIQYATARDREAIKLILGDGKYFFGVPYQMQNT